MRRTLIAAAAVLTLGVAACGAETETEEVAVGEEAVLVEGAEGEEAVVVEEGVLAEQREGATVGEGEGIVEEIVEE